jgi:hypothetical protein
LAYPDETTDEPSRHELADETTLVAIDECGDRVSVLCTELLRGTDTREAIRRELEALGGLLDSLGVSR